MISECYTKILTSSKRIEGSTGKNVCVFENGAISAGILREFSWWNGHLSKDAKGKEKKTVWLNLYEEDFRQDRKKGKWKTKKPNVLIRKGACGRTRGQKEKGACRPWRPVVQDKLKVRDTFSIKWNWYILNSFFFF